MTITQQIITIGLCVAGIMLTRLLPFAIFSEKNNSCIRAVSRKIAASCGIRYAGRLLP